MNNNKNMNDKIDVEPTLEDALKLIEKDEYGLYINTLNYVKTRANIDFHNAMNNIYEAATKPTDGKLKGVMAFIKGFNLKSK